MSFRLSPLQRKEIADKFLLWLRDHNIRECDHTYDLIRQGAEGIGEQPHNIWKAYDLLRLMGRIELKNPNGKHGFRVIDYTRLSVLVLKSNAVKQDIERQMLVKILRFLKKQHKDIWADALQVITEES